MLCGRNECAKFEAMPEPATVIDVGMNTLTDEASVRRLYPEDHPRLARFRERGTLLVGDVHPDRLDDLPDPPWVHAWGIGLDPSKWESDRLFAPQSAPRSLEPIRRMLTPGLTVEDTVLHMSAAG